MNSAVGASAILFDMDGVLIDSMPHHLLAFNAVLSRWGRSVEMDQIAGRSTIDVMTEVLGQDITKDVLENLCREKSSRSRVFLRNAGREVLVPGVEQLLRMIPSSKKRAICTSASKESVEWLLSNLLPDVNFDCVLTSAQVRRSKPDPEIYLTAASLLSESPSDCLVVEDSAHGVSAGLAAGCLVVHFLPSNYTTCECTAHDHISQIHDVMNHL